MFALLYLLAVVAAANLAATDKPIPGALGSAGAVGEIPILNLVEVFSTDDYPAEALRLHQEGMVKVRIKTDASGKPVKCTVVKSTGFASLDRVTCEKIMLAARLRIGNDHNAQPKSTTQSVRINWVLPWPPLEESRHRLIVAVDANGKPGPCRSEPVVQYDLTEFCKQLVDDLNADLKADSDGLTYYGNRDFLHENGLLLGGEEALNSAMSQPGIVGWTALALALKVDEQGKVRSCKVVNREDQDAERDACAREVKVRYEPLDSSATNRQSRNAIVYGATVVRETKR